MSHLILSIVVALLLPAAAAASRCDEVRASYSDVVFCEDFENPGYNSAGPLQSGHAFYDAYGPASNPKCEGPTSCHLDIVAPGECNASGESGASCVFDGSQALGFHFQPGIEGGSFGDADWGRRLKTFGITYALRLSSGWDHPATGLKFNRSYGPQRDVDGTVHEILGVVSNGGYIAKDEQGFQGLLYGDTTPSNAPFQVHWDIDVCGSFNESPRSACVDVDASVVNVGQWGSADTHAFAQPSVTGNVVYRYPDLIPNGTSALGEWMCFQAHVSDWGESNARLRWWINGTPVIDIDRVDMSQTKGLDKQGQDGVRWEMWVNGGASTDSYRYEDNWVVTSAGEPVPCSEIGFSANYDPPDPVYEPPPNASPPAPPILLP